MNMGVPAPPGSGNSAARKDYEPIKVFVSPTCGFTSNWLSLFSAGSQQAVNAELHEQKEVADQLRAVNVILGKRVLELEAALGGRAKAQKEAPPGASNSRNKNMNTRSFNDTEEELP